MQENENSKRCGGCGGQDMEMKNAVAIQRNAAAIAATIKALQALQAEVERLREIIEGDSDNQA